MKVWRTFIILELQFGILTVLELWLFEAVFQVYVQSNCLPSKYISISSESEGRGGADRMGGSGYGCFRGAQHSYNCRLGLRTPPQRGKGEGHRSIKYSCSQLNQLIIEKTKLASRWCELTFFSKTFLAGSYNVMRDSIQTLETLHKQKTYFNAINIAPSSSSLDNLSLITFLSGFTHTHTFSLSHTLVAFNFTLSFWSLYAPPNWKVDVTYCSLWPISPAHSSNPKFASRSTTQQIDISYSNTYEGMLQVCFDYLYT